MHDYVFLVPADMCVRNRLFSVAIVVVGSTVPCVCVNCLTTEIGLTNRKQQHFTTRCMSTHIRTTTTKQGKKKGARLSIGKNKEMRTVE